MKTNQVVVLSAIFCGLWPWIAVAAERQWTSKAGTKVEAELIQQNGDVVTLKMQNGREIQVKASDLSEADQAFLEGQKSQTAEVVSGSQKRLPVLASGEGKGLYALYRGDDYVARVSKSGSMKIHPIVDGKVNEKWFISIDVDIYEQQANDREKFWFESFEDYAQAAENPSQVRFVGTRRGGTTCEVIYGFEKNAVTTWFRADPSQELQSKDNMVYRVRHFVGKTTDMDASEKFSKRCRVKQEMIDGNKRKYNFWETLKFGGESKEIEIDGPMLGKHKMVFKRGGSESVKFSPYQYGESPLSGGFAIYMYKPDPTTKDHDAEKVTITIK
ncbi:SLA1 homology domain 1, SHD1 [Rubritalea squalenifaciens DSM 18772]|uniref:SLA1 homology domain 1, SHD1 n=1 Tax=Rubritalea squalenifaciens DSM 18772 TaxID=1123071 RepID=A0A1M6E0T8_9BACT|nr:SHD1 domain-containing protein [Rubritalea squalenifaciens]SHI79005.1 SLA1 homology domain 1, SHD1 [Rubritalea squalenifaciens DSM 18772]